MRHDNILEGIKLIAIGKTGSRSLTKELVHLIYDDIIQNKVTPIQKAIFFVSLHYKGFEENEHILKEICPSSFSIDLNETLNFLIRGDIDIEFRNLLLILLKGDHLSLQQATLLGNFIFNISTESSTSYNCAKVIAAILLRVRYSNEDEYSGLYDALMKTIQPNFTNKCDINYNLIQLSEPFNGMESNYLLTPILCNYFIQKKYRTICLTGESSGPKYGCNLLEIAKGLNAPFLKSNHEIKDSPYGAYVDLADVSLSWKHWVNLRKEMIKRPFMATLEKFPNIFNAGINITSAFHEPFTSKMLALSEYAGYPGNIVIRKGREGSLSFSLSKSVEIQCSAIQKNGTYKRYNFEYSLENLGEILEEDGRKNINVSDNIDEIKTYSMNAKTYDIKFNKRIQLTLSGINQAVHWIKNNMEKK